MQFVDPLINGEKQFPQPIFEIKVVDSKPVITVVEPKAAQNVPQLQNQQSDVNTQSDIQNALTEFFARVNDQSSEISLRSPMLEKVQQTIVGLLQNGAGVDEVAKELAKLKVDAQSLVTLIGGSGK